ncbi:hypothetical protein FEM48_Zijuj03G0156900 [Ziziphus jujuba var. spinosa]|uniref:Uncharacterized protein n=1 Tax=Ziziphus jujuba var. spinosa TaxID=714518 RepID=A0A978VR63_ZIZJJ|nr:hypothetical protein FEM48_Zijuj03G0156900 [Ziziphus jujuba var. spinosa]
MTFVTLPIAWLRGLMVRTAVITGHVQKFLLRRPYPLSENYFGVPKMASLVDFSMNKLSGEIPPNLQRRWHNPPKLRTKPEMKMMTMVCHGFIWAWEWDLLWDFGVSVVPSSSTEHGGTIALSFLTS